MAAKVAALAAAAAAAAATAALAAPVPLHRRVPLADAVTKEGIYEHLRAFEEIAKRPENEGSRATFLGYNASVDYVVSQLSSNTDYEITIQSLPVTLPVYTTAPNLSLSAPVTATFELNTDFLGFNYGGSGDVIAATQLVRAGCETADFADFIPGRIAIINRGAYSPSGVNATTCSYRVKVTNAIQAGAAGVLVYNPEDALPTLGGTDPGTAVPVFAISSAAATFIIEYGDAALINMNAWATVVPYTTLNVLASTRGGDANATIVVGAHLDSVPAGAGINDNGSGSAGVLEIALQFYRQGVAPVNRVTFAWWAAEEWGLLGSQYYVDHLSEEAIKSIALNLNYDMIGSPNYIRGVYDGRSGPEDVRTVRHEGSANIQRVFETHFEERGLTYQTTPFNGRSDYGPFIELTHGQRGVPAGGLFTGAEEIKTVEQQEMFGGSAKAALDTCYHRSCDTVANINPDAIAEMGSAAADVVEILATMPNLREFLSTPIVA